MLDVKKAAEYFAHHLARATWEAKSEEERRSALAMAEQDVSLELGGVELDYANPLALAAVCEQALFLLTGGGESSGGSANAALVSSESVEGIGSRTYRAGLTESDFALGSRARRFLELLRRELSGGGGAVRLSRG